MNPIDDIISQWQALMNQLIIFVLLIIILLVALWIIFEAWPAWKKLKTYSAIGLAS